MEVRGLFSKWWFITLVSLAVGGLVYLIQLFTLEYPSTSAMWLYSLVFFEWAVILTCILMIVVPWRPLGSERGMDPVALRQAGYEVTLRGSDFDLRVEKYSVVRIRESDGAFSYRTLPTSTGFVIVLLLFFSSYLTILAFPFLPYIYARGEKGLKIVAPKIGALPRSSEKGLDELVMDSVTVTYMMARQAVDARRSDYHDHIIILLSMALLGFAVLLSMNAQYLFEADERVWRMGAGTILLIFIVVAGSLLLRRQARRTMEMDERWAERLMAVMRGAAPDEGSVVELLLRACSEAPRWLSVHRKGIWYRRPGMTLLIALLLDQGAIFLINGSGFVWAYGLGGICLSLGVVLMLDQYRRGRKESDDLEKGWNRKMMDLETVLGLTVER